MFGTLVLGVKVGGYERHCSGRGAAGDAVTPNRGNVKGSPRATPTPHMLMFASCCPLF